MTLTLWMSIECYVSITFISAHFVYLSCVHYWRNQYLLRDKNIIKIKSLLKIYIWKRGNRNATISLKTSSVLYELCAAFHSVDRGVQNPSGLKNCTFNLKLGGEDPPAWFRLWWQTPGKAGALNSKTQTKQEALFCQFAVNASADSSAGFWRPSLVNVLTGWQTSLSASHTCTSQWSHTVDTFSSRWKRKELNLKVERLSLAFSKILTVLSEEQLTGGRNTENSVKHYEEFSFITIHQRHYITTYGPTLNKWGHFVLVFFSWKWLLLIWSEIRMRYFYVVIVL